MIELVKYKMRVFYIKLFSWEYWPMWLVYLPVSFYYVYLALKAKSLFFFSAANPSIETGGMFFESKWSIFKLIPKKYYPSTILINKDDDDILISAKMTIAGIQFPIIAKPDRGERGWCVQKIGSVKELSVYRRAMKVDFLVQVYVNYPMEFSVFYFRNPNKSKGMLTSVTLKKLLTIKGDGHSTINDLVKRSNRSFLQYYKLKKNTKIDFNRILESGKEEIIVPYGNHALGAMFLNYNHIIDENLINTFDQISKQIDGFYFGRFDLRCTSIEDLKVGKNIAILELNGAGAEPAHIYDPSFSFFKAQSVLASHYKMIYQAAIINNMCGVPFMSYKEFMDTRKLETEYKQNVQFK